jgi:WD40 repeat protein
MATRTIDFTSERERHEQLLGRQDVVAELDQLLRGGGVSRGWVLVKGGPGMGKSALLSHYLSRLEAQDRAVPHHFLRRGVEDWDRPEVVRENLAARVEALFPEQAVSEARPESRLREVLQRVSQEVLVPHRTRLVLVIDGLDEAESDAGGANPLQRFLPHALPRGVWVLCASRPTYPHLAWLEAREGVHCIDLDDAKWAPSNETVVQKYWERAAPGFMPPLKPDFVAEAVRRAGGNVLYAVKLAEWLREQPVERRRAEQLPRGLKAFLEELWQGVQSQPRELRTVVLDGLGLVAAARESLPLSVLASVAGWEEGVEERFLRVARQLLLEDPAHWLGERAWRPFHESFRAFILLQLGEERVRREHRRLVEWLGGWPVERGANDFRRRYALRHSVTHRLDAGALEEACSLCTDLGYLEAKCQEAGVTAVEEDLLRTAKATSGSEQTSSLWELHRAIQTESHWLRTEPAAGARIIYNRLLCMGWTSARMEEELRFSGGLPSLRLRHPVRMGAGEIRTLVGHGRPVNACAMTPDGRLAFSASDDDTLKLWDLQTGRELATLTGHEAKVTACALTPDGRRALSASWDRTLKLWDLQTGRDLATRTGHDGGVTACALTPDGRLGLSASWDRTLKLWDLQSRRELATLQGHAGPVWACALTPDGRLALSASRDRTLKLWDLQTGRELVTLTGHEKEVMACALTPDGRLALSASDDQTLKLWNLQTGKVLATLVGHDGLVSTCALSPDGLRAISASRDRTLKLWDLPAQRELMTFTGHDGGVTACALSLDGRLALSASDDRTLKLWELQARRELATLTGHTGSVDACALTPDGCFALSASAFDPLRLWDLKAGRELATLSGHDGPVSSCAISSNGRLALSASDETLKMWDLKAGCELATFSVHKGKISSCAISSNGRLVLAAFERTLKLWDIKGGGRATLRGHEGPISSCALTPNGRRALSASWDRTLRLWDLKNECELMTLKGHTGSVWACAISPDGKFALSASEDCSLKVWDLQAGQELMTLMGHEDSVDACAFTPDGRFVLSASFDRTLKLWDPWSGRCLKTTCGGGSFTTVAAAGEVICTGDTLGNVWVLENGAPKQKEP